MKGRAESVLLCLSVRGRVQSSGVTAVNILQSQAAIRGEVPSAQCLENLRAEALIGCQVGCPVRHPGGWFDG